jgi:sugar/nucleoside kinase (ribokinase family)
MGRVCVLSSTNLDVCFITSDLPTDWNDEVYVDKIELAIGGKGFLMAEAAAWLGARVVLLTPQGNDDSWPIIEASVRATREALTIARNRAAGWPERQRPGSLRAVFHKSGGPTGLVGALGSANHRPTYLTRRERLHWGSFQLPQSWRDEIMDSAVLLTSLEPPIPLVKEAVQVAKGKGAKVVLNPGPPPRNELDRTEAQRLLREVDALVLDTLEAKALVFGKKEEFSSAIAVERLLLSSNGLDLLCVTVHGSLYSAAVADGGRVTTVLDRGMRLVSDPVGSNAPLSAGVALGMALSHPPTWCLNFGLGAAALCTGHEQVNIQDILDHM